MSQHSDDSVLREMLSKTLRKSHSRRRASVQRVGRLDEKFWYTECDRCQCTGGEFKVCKASPYVVIAIMRNHFEQEHALECAFCFLKFAGFKELAEHVNDAHVSETAKAEREQREAWHPNNEGDNDMALPQPGGGKRDSQRDSGRSGSQRPAPKVPFLKVEDLTEEPSRAKILGVQTQNTGFNDIIVKVAIRGKSYFFGLKASNQNYEALFDAFGDNENKWVGEEFLVGLNFNDFYEKQFVHVFEAPAKPIKAAKK
jgi:hypothetical protein